MPNLYTLGVDLGGTNIAVGVVDTENRIILKGSVPTNAERAPEAIIADMGALCDRLLADAKLDVSQIEYVGIASPGIANRDRGVIEYANNLPFSDFPIAAELKKHISVPKVLIENDANAAAKGEAVAGAARGCNYAVMITLGTGVGGGIIIDKKVYSGFNFAGAELGHIVIQHDGRQCSCGRKGCWEAYSSATGLIAMTKEEMARSKDSVMHEMCGNDMERVSGRTAFNAAKAGDAAGQRVVDMYIDYLACGIGNIINIFQPEVLCIGGGVANEGDYLLRPLIAKTDREQYSRDSMAKTQIKIAALGNDAGIIGAAVLGR